MDTSAKDCLALFDTSRRGASWHAAGQSGVLHQRTRTVKAGPDGLCGLLPGMGHERRMRGRASTEAKKEAHAKAQKRLDAKTAGTSRSSSWPTRTSERGT